MRRRLIIACLVIAAAAAAVIGISFYQPPMRLMPAPEAFLGGGASVLTADPAAALDPRISVFYATNRLAIGPAGARVYAVIPGFYLHLGTATLRIGDDATTWQRIYEWSTQTSHGRRPFLHLEGLSERASFDDSLPPTPESQAWFAEIEEALQRSRLKDVIVYVHGANTTMERAAGQAAQLRHFTGREAVVVLFAWPTAENFLFYPRDMLTALGAAPHLARLIELLSENTSAEHIDVFTYSAGATVGSEGLALAGRAAELPGASPLRLGEVYHAAPDADFRGFVDDLRGYAGKARRVSVAVNMNDSALRLSQIVNRASRAGRPDIAELDPEATEWLLEATSSQGLDLLRVRPENIPGLSKRSHTFWYDDPWISSDVLMTLLFHVPARERGLSEGVVNFGGRYWTFPPDYPERLSAVMRRLNQ
jgi:hypothetical protein